MGAEGFDFKDYFTIAGCVFVLLLIFFYVGWFIYDLKTKYTAREGKLKDEEKAKETQAKESQEAKWLDKKLLIMVIIAPIVFYGNYFVLYYSCRLFSQLLIGMVYWALCGIYPLILLVYILVSEWHHEEVQYGEKSLFQAITGRSISGKLMELRDRDAAVRGGGNRP